MKSEPLVTVITVSYNCKEMIEKTILSVLSQTYPKIEYIIIDGGSTDGTLDIIRKYESRIDKWISEADNGIYDAMNKGISIASGKWLNFMNAGDVFYNNTVVADIFSLSISPEIAVLYSDVYRYSDDFKQKIVYENDRNIGTINHQATIYRKSLHIKYGQYLTSRPYSVYDLLFFLSIPKELFYKVKYPIALVEPNGVSSQGFWVIEKAMALYVLFGYKTLTQAFFIYWRRIFKYRILSLFRR